MTRKVVFFTLSVLPLARPAAAETFVFSTPSDDRWQYPFNFTPGTRSVASCFGAAAIPGFNDRDGIVIAAWDTSGFIPPGQGAANYSLDAVRVTLTNQPGATWSIDLSPDPWHTFDLNQDGGINLDGIPRGEPGDTDGESTDSDPGRPVELFGTGFGPTYSPSTWNEFSFYEGSDGTSDLPRDPFPFMFRTGTLELLHVENHVKGQFNGGLSPPFCGPPDAVCPFTPQPWAVGVPIGYSPGAQSVPFAVVFDIDVTQSEGAVRAWYQECLNEGRVFATITSLADTEMFGDPSGFPSFYMKEALAGSNPPPGAAAASLTIVLCHPADLDCDDDRDSVDVSILVATLLGVDSDPDHFRRSDQNADGVVDGRDTGPFIEAFLSPL